MLTAFLSDCLSITLVSHSYTFKISKSVLYRTIDSGVARILHWGPQKLSAKGARIEAPKAARGVRIGEGCPPPQSTRGSGGASCALPAGSRAETRPPTHFWHI